MMFLAMRHLLSRRRQTFFIFFGIVLGSLTYVVIAAMQLGFQEYMIAQLIENEGHIKIKAHEFEKDEAQLKSAFYPSGSVEVDWAVPPYGKMDESHIQDPRGWLQRLSLDPEVAAYAEQLSMQVISSRGGARATANLVGISPDRQLLVSRLDDYMDEGSIKNIGYTGNRVVVGSGLLDTLGARLDDTIFLASGTQAPRPFRVVGSITLGIKQLDDALLYGALSDVQQLNKTPGRISQIAVRLHDVAEAQATAARWNQYSRDEVQSWDQANASYMQVFRIQDLFRYFVTIGVMLVASFGIYNVLSIIVNQKRREVAILRSLGYEQRDILWLFLLQGILLGVAGAFIGLFMGYGVCRYLSSMRFDMLGPRGLTISYSIGIYAQGFLMATLSSMLASFIPAYSASRMTPIDIIRMEG
jgi:lipoprotein-releasing system permease protein